MLVVQPENRISIPNILAHKWLKVSDNIEGDVSDDGDDAHDFEVSLMFGRTECNFNPLLGVVGSNQNSESN